MRMAMLLGLYSWALASIYSNPVYGQETDKPFTAPKIWDARKLADWAVPHAGANANPDYISEHDYYSSPSENLRTYPVYHPDDEPVGYQEWLRKQPPKRLVVLGEARTTREWEELGRQVFDELDQAGARTDDPKAFTYLRDRDALKKDGTTTALITDEEGTVRRMIPGFR